MPVPARRRDQGCSAPAYVAILGRNRKPVSTENLAGIAQIWNETAIVVITEFGRTAQGNGTDGTDHGTGTVAFVLGGAVAGGRVKLLDARDLNPTIDLRSVFADPSAYRIEYWLKLSSPKAPARRR